MIGLNIYSLMWFAFLFYLLVTSRYLVITCGNLVVTSGCLIATTGYFWLLLITFRYVQFLALVTTRSSAKYM